jgi:cytochrome c556
MAKRLHHDAPKRKEPLKGTTMRNVVLVLLASALLTTTTPAQERRSSRATTNSAQKRAAAASGSPFKLAASVQQVMTAITVPASDVIFDAAAATETTKVARWENIQNSALTLAESGNLLMLPGRAPDKQEWVKQSQAMIDAAMLAFDAAANRNTERLSAAGDRIYATCEACHNKYMNKGN